ncbi:hypothetical protein IPL68_03975 [Candidatus Saccharibacteria bacterium]|nr:MAG: hypothetical protein IPL68_03975 [Candidatus Saccharibacteria bacterium]
MQKPTTNYQLPTTESPLVVIVGETASGKSALAMELARQFEGEILCADAMTVYTGFDIGTAKPSARDQAEITHHLLDIADPAQGFNAAQFKHLAERAITDIAAHGNYRLWSVAAGLYVDSLLYDYQFTDSPNIGERDVLNTMTLAELRLLAESRGFDTTSIDSANPRRLIRLIESGGKQAVCAPMRENTCVIGLRLDRENLNRV